METLILGIDDAGRGPVIGPLILAGCLIDEKTRKEFKKIGITDSKDLTKKRREVFEEIIKEKSIGIEYQIITPEKIEEYNKKETKLNEVEAIYVAKIINKLNKKQNKIKIVVDCPSVNRVKWCDYLKTKVKDLSNLEVSCEHKADQNHVSVSAASIIAKCIREKEMDKIREKFGNEVGSGYTSDPLTQKFLKKYAKKYANSQIFRKTWITWQKAYNELAQEKLF